MGFWFCLGLDPWPLLPSFLLVPCTPWYQSQMTYSYPGPLLNRTSTTPHCTKLHSLHLVYRHMMHNISIIPLYLIQQPNLGHMNSLNTGTFILWDRSHLLH